MRIITTIQEYCREINIPDPKLSFFDIRRFEDNMKTVNRKQTPFRHEFYAIALRNFGSNKEVHGEHLDRNLFFNSPFQIITWDIQPDWTGWYIIFDKDFLALNPCWQNFLTDFPFFRLDTVAPITLPKADADFATHIFGKISDEYHSDNNDKSYFLQAYTQLLLLITNRYFDTSEKISNLNIQGSRTADILLVSRFQSMVETSITNENASADIRYPSYYAEKLMVHPNHLNAIVKKITAKTTTNIIQIELISVAKSLLRQTGLSIKEIAFRLSFNKPTHFNSYFKKLTGFTPQQYRQTNHL